jgi:hypothetical protein
MTLPMRQQSISHAWKTSIQENINGDEKRTALYTWPRISLDIKLGLSSQAHRRFIRAHFYRNIHNTWGIPVRYDKSLLTSEAASAQAILTMDDTGNRHFYDGRSLLLINPDAWETYEFATITTVDSQTQITLSANLTSTWPVGTLVFPCYECRIRPVQQINVKRRNVNELLIDTEESFETERSFTYSVPSSGAATYDSLDLFVKKPLLPIKEHFKHPFDLHGFLGKQYVQTDYDETRFSFTRSFNFSTRLEIWDMLNFFDSKRGRFQVFYTPTWADDFIVTSAIASADTTLTVEPVVYLSTAEIVNRHLYIQFPDGSYTCRKITGLPTSTTVQLDGAVGSDVAIESVSKMIVCFLYKVHFGSDDIVIDFYPGGSIAKTSITFDSVWET